MNRAAQHQWCLIQISALSNVDGKAVFYRDCNGKGEFEFNFGEVACKAATSFKEGSCYSGLTRFLNILRILNMAGFWKCEGAKYASSFEYDTVLYTLVLNMPRLLGFWIWLGFWILQSITYPSSQYAKVTQGSGCASSSECVKVLNMPRVLHDKALYTNVANMQNLRRVLNIWYAWIMPKYSWLCLNKQGSAYVRAFNMPVRNGQHKEVVQQR